MTKMRKNHINCGNCEKLAERWGKKVEPKIAYSGGAYYGQAPLHSFVSSHHTEKGRKCWVHIHSQRVSGTLAGVPRRSPAAPSRGLGRAQRRRRPSERQEGPASKGWCWAGSHGCPHWPLGPHIQRSLLSGKPPTHGWVGDPPTHAPMGFEKIYGLAFGRAGLTTDSPWGRLAKTHPPKKTKPTRQREGPQG